MSSFWSGTPEKNYQQSLLEPGQQGLKRQLIKAGQTKGAGGAFGDSADYYRDLLSNDSQTFKQMQAPEMRQFNEQIIPDLSEQFAGMGSGGLDSSGFRNAAVGAGTDLSERLGAIRANLRQQGAAGLAGIGQQGLGQFSENIHRPATPGFLDTAVNGLTQAAIGIGGDYLKQGISSKGQSSPYGSNTSPQGPVRPF